MSTKPLQLSMALLMGLLTFAPALADDLNPPPWRGDEGSTMQHWSFDSQPGSWSNIPPEIVNNPYGSPTASVCTFPCSTPGWYDNFQGRQGVIYGQRIDLDIPNRAEPLVGKVIWLQVVSDALDPVGTVTVTPQGSDSYTVTLLSTQTTPLEGNWEYKLYKWQITPNPDSETMELTGKGGLIIDQIVVDTLCTDVLPTGACCDDVSGVCTDNMTHSDCLSTGGPYIRYGGDGSDCATIDPSCVPAPTGACCDDAAGVCTEDVAQAVCEDGGDRYGGDASDCGTIDPPCEVGACCHGDIGVCSELDYDFGVSSARFMAYDPAFGTAGQVVHTSGAQIYYWDLASGTQRGSTLMISTAKGLAVDTGRRKSFTTRRLSGEFTRSVAVTDLDTMTQIANIGLSEPIDAARGVAVIPSTGKILVAVKGSGQSNGLMLVNPVTQTLEAALQNIHHSGSFANPIDVAVLEENGLSVAVVANETGGFVTLVPLGDITYVPNEEPPGGQLPSLPKISLNGGALAIAGDPANNRAVISWNNGSTQGRVQIVTITSNSTGSASPNINLNVGGYGNPVIEQGLEMDPARNLVYVAAGADGTAVVDLLPAIVLGNLHGLDTTTLSVAAAPDRDSVLMVGVGPNLSERCPVFCDDAVTQIDCELTGGLYAGNGSNCASNPGCGCGDKICGPGESHCNCQSDCGAPTGEVPGSTCSDGVDNNCNGFIDCMESSCATDPACVPPVACSERQKITPPPPSPQGDLLGTSVALDGDAALGGAPWDGEVAVGAGAAYVYRWNGAAWVQEAKLMPSDSLDHDLFGSSVAISGNVALVGLLGNTYYESHPEGAAYVFRYNGTSWPEEQKLTASDGAPDDQFGWSVAIDGDVAIVGARYDGSGYVFRYNGATWDQEDKLTASDGGWLGYSVSISGDVAILGAEGDDDAGSNSGAAYVFRYNGVNWDQEEKLTASDAGAGDRFGYSVSLDGNLGLIGAYYQDGICVWDLDCVARGSAYVFRREGTTWIEEQKLSPVDGAEYDRFGWSVSLKESYAVIGAETPDGSGAAYVFKSEGDGWIAAAKLVASDGAPDDEFAFSVAIGADRALVGARGNDGGGSGSGAVYAFCIPCDCFGECTAPPPGEIPGSTCDDRLDNDCDGDTDCDDPDCWADSMCWICGNTRCDPNEDSCNCWEDCGSSCGDGCCNGSETACDCPQDGCVPACGDGCCNGSETECDCPQDGCVPTCGDGCCNGSETACDCPQDGCVPTCGDGCCNGSETECDCPQDGCVPACGDSCCNGSETACDCLQDGCVPACGDGCCNGSEDSCSCETDCGAPAPSEVPGATCDDGVDNDCDALTDCDDPDCQVVFGDIVAPFCPPDCPQPDLADIMCLLEDFAGGPPVDGCVGSVYSTDLAPCVGDGILDLDDILNALDAFAQVSQCPAPCP